MAVIPMGKSRTYKNPYLVVEGQGRYAGWRWSVLKAYSTNPDAVHARWFCSVESPFLDGGREMGDTYIAEVQGRITFRDPEVSDISIPAHLRR